MLLFIAAPLWLALYYAVLIIAKGRSRKAGPVVVRYAPPSELSPAAVRYIWRGCVDQRTVACVFAGLATKGRISLERTRGGYKLTKTKAVKGPALDAEEQSTMEWLFSNFLETTTFDPQGSAQGCMMSLRGLLDRRLRGEYQSARLGWITLGFLASFGASMLLAWSSSHDRSASLMFAWMWFWSAALAGITIAYMLVPAAADLAHGIGRIGRLIFAFAISAFVLVAMAGVIKQFSRTIPSTLAVVIGVLVAINLAAVPLLRSVTPKGMEAREQIEGFREYLLKVEQDPLNRMIKPNSAPPQSASLLAYAIALEVKEAWGDDLVNACFPG